MDSVCGGVDIAATFSPSDPDNKLMYERSLASSDVLLLDEFPAAPDNFIEELKNLLNYRVGERNYRYGVHEYPIGVMILTSNKSLDKIVKGDESLGAIVSRLHPLRAELETFTSASDCQNFYESMLIKKGVHASIAHMSSKAIQFNPKSKTAMTSIREIEFMAFNITDMIKEAYLSEWYKNIKLNLETMPSISGAKGDVRNSIVELISMVYVRLDVKLIEQCVQAYCPAIGKYVKLFNNGFIVDGNLSEKPQITDAKQIDEYTFTRVAAKLKRSGNKKAEGFVNNAVAIGYKELIRSYIDHLKKEHGDKANTGQLEKMLSTSSYIKIAEQIKF
jgi:hypothetical protein